MCRLSTFSYVQRKQTLGRLFIGLVDVMGGVRLQVAQAGGANGHLRQVLLRASLQTQPDLITEYLLLLSVVIYISMVTTYHPPGSLCSKYTPNQKETYLSVR
jgi:hypothetical protein